MPPAAPRAAWPQRHQFVLGAVSACVGPATLWRFPYLCHRNGGGVFLVPYFILLLLVGLPLLLLELSLGQLGGLGAVAVWRCCPLLRGAGVAALLVAALVSLYLTVTLAWSFYYLVASMTLTQPWSCLALHNWPLCQSNFSNGSQRGPSETFWNEKVLGVTQSSGLGDPGAMRLSLAMYLLAAWCVVALRLLQGLRGAGKLLYVMAPLPHLVLLAVLIGGATLDGAADGVRFFGSADWHRLRSAQVWSDAASQVFFSLGIGFGGQLTLASYNRLDNNVVRDALLITAAGAGTSLLAGFTTFSALGYMARRHQVPVGDVVLAGPGMPFIAYSEIVAHMPGSIFWCLIFFLTLWVQGSDSLFGTMEGIVRGIQDAFPALHQLKLKIVLLLGLCIGFYLLGLLLVTEGGIFWFVLLDEYSTSFGFLFAMLCMSLGVAYCYGLRQLRQDIEAMLRRCPRGWSRALGCAQGCWALVTPALLLVALVFAVVHVCGAVPRYGASALPAWGRTLGICIGVLVCVQPPLWAAAALAREAGTLRDRFRKATQPRRSWRAAREEAQAMAQLPLGATLPGGDAVGTSEL